MDPTPQDPVGVAQAVLKPVEPAAPQVKTGLQSDRDRECVSRVLELFDHAREARRPLIPRWKESHRLLYNRYWQPNARPGWMPSPQVPEIYPLVDSLIGLLLAQKPRHTVAPEALPHSAFAQWFGQVADDLEITMDVNFHANRESAEWEAVLWDVLTYGTGITKTCWEPWLAGGLGDAISRRCDPFCIYPDPNGTSDRDLEYIIEARDMTCSELDRRYPGAGELVRRAQAVTHDIDESPSSVNWGDGGGHALNPGPVPPRTDQPTYVKGGGKGRRVGDDTEDKVTVLECWVRESYATEIEWHGETTDASGDCWRVYVVAGNVLLMDEPAENLWMHGSHPYARLPFREKGEFWSVGLVELLGSAQKTINRILASIQQNVELTGNPIWKEPPGGGRSQIVNRPGQRHQSRDPQASGWEAPPPLHPVMIQLVQYLLSRMREIAGVGANQQTGPLGGRPPEGVVDMMQESSHLRVQALLKALERCMATSGEKKASLICEFYNTPRMIALAGKQGERSALTLRARHFSLPSSTGEVPLRYQLRVDMGSETHLSRGAREDLWFKLFGLGGVDIQSLLEHLGIPNAAQIAQKVLQQRAMGLADPPGKRQRARS